MSLTDPVLRVVLYEGAGADSLSSDERFEAIAGLLANGYGVERRTSKESNPISDRRKTLVMGCFGESAPAWEGADKVSDITSSTVEEIVGRADSERDRSEAVNHSEWKPWFPVIDYDRCTNCMQCLSFCLFGVYGVDDDQQIEVRNNDSCKTNCPACSRVCPEAAIMFPKYKAGPINGEPVSSSDLNREKMKVDISALLGGDVYDLLRQRSEKAKSRFSKERDSDKALKERQKCLVKLKESMDVDIPPEVLMSLPSQDEILRRAEEAKSKAEDALSRQRGSQETP